MKRYLIAVIILLILAAGAYVYWMLGMQPAASGNTSQKIFVVNKGETVREIGNSLKKEGLIKDPIVFFLYIKMNGQDKNIQAGDYRLSPSMDLAKVVDSLQHGSLDIWVTVPEGMRADEIADILAKDIPSYNTAWREELDRNEGYLFPDTYLIPRDADAATVVSMMKNNFSKRILDAGLSENTPGFTRAIIIASLVEREAKTDAEKPVIAGIIKNRLDIGMALQVDATVQYAKGYDKVSKRWWPEVTLADYKAVNSSYNTYLSAGLPPGPISNPGIEAIKAALNPEDNPYLFYIHDTSGKIHVAKTQAEHDANIQKYLY